jgi:large subunit ribosomal protein L25
VFSFVLFQAAPSETDPMAETVKLQTKKREGRGTRKAQKLRVEGMVPAILYGHKLAAVQLSLEHKPLVEAIRHGVRVVEITTDKGTENAQIVEVQWDYLGKDVVHVDLKRVDKDERIHVHVPIELKGIAPGVTAGGQLDQPLHTLHVECPALDVPDSVRVVINELQLEQAIHVKDLKLPEGVKALDDPEAVVVHVILKQAEAEPAAEGEPGAAEPEVITRKKAEEETEE